MRRLLNAALATLTLALIGLLATPSAQAQLTTINTQRRTTYSASITALAPAASATDFLTIIGSATKTVWVHEFRCSGISTAAATATVTAVKRSTANTGGTATTPTAVPHDSASAAGTAVVSAYTANPTVGTAVGTVRSGKISTNTAATSAFAEPEVVWEFGADGFTQPIVLRGVAQSVSLNGAGASFTAGAALNCSVTWSE